MKVSVDSDVCQGHMRCVALAPAIFGVDDEGYAVADGVAVPEADRQLALRAQANCPERAIRVDSA